MRDGQLEVTPQFIMWTLEYKLTEIWDNGNRTYSQLALHTAKVLSFRTLPGALAHNALSPGGQVPTCFVGSKYRRYTVISTLLLTLCVCACVRVCVFLTYVCIYFLHYDSTALVARKHGAVVCPRLTDLAGESNY